MEGNSASKVVHWLVGILIVFLIAAGALFIYLRGQNTEEIAVNSPTTETATDTTDSSASAETDIDTAVSELDDELTILAEDEASDDDTISL